MIKFQTKFDHVLTAAGKDISWKLSATLDLNNTDKSY